MQLYEQLNIINDRVKINDFQIGYCLGRGANSACYDAFLTSTGKRCVVKVFNDRKGTSSTFKILRTLKGEDLCYIADLTTSNNYVRSFGYHFGKQLFLFYEKMDCSLNNFNFDENNKIMQIIEIAYDLFGALRHLHNQKCKLFHKDVHIENVLMLGNHAKLGDLESVGSSDTVGVEGLQQNESQWESFDVRAVGYIMCQLITGKKEMQYYPGKRSPSNGYPTPVQLERYSQLFEEAKECIRMNRFFNLKLELIQFLENIVNAHDGNYSSKNAWKYINNYLSPRFHGDVETTTNFDDDGLGNILYLDRHQVFVADYASVLRSFNLIRNEDYSKIGFKFSRQRILNVPVSALSINYYYTETRFYGGLKEDTTFNLVGLAVNPPRNYRKGFLKGFHLRREDENGNFDPTKIRIQFALIEGGGVWDDNPQEHVTNFADGGDGKTYFLDRHLVKAPENHAITGFVIESNQSQEIRFKFWTQRYH